VQIYKSVLQPGLVLLPCHSIHSQRSIPLEGVEAVLEQDGRHMMEQGGEPLLPITPRSFAHSVQSLGHFLPLCVGSVLDSTEFSLVTGLPSTASAFRVSTVLVRLLHRYYAHVRLLAGVHAWLLLLASQADPLPVGRGCQ
jgi:hypothetical protein